MRSSTRARATAWCGVLAALVLLASACGGSDAQADGTPTGSTKTGSTPTQTPTPTATPTPTPPSEPLSPFEDEAPVKAARVWAAAVGKAVNAKDQKMASLAAVATPNGIRQTVSATEYDLNHGYSWPGPQPFTPVSVKVTGNRAVLNTCLLTDGWSVHPKTGKRVNPRKVSGIVLVFRKATGVWKFDDSYTGTADCAGVKVEGVTW